MKNSTKNARYILAVILTVMLFVGTFAATVFADDDSEDITYTEMSLETEYTATIDEAGGYAYFSFTPSESGNYVIYSTGGYDTFAYLHDADMKQLSSDNDSGDSYNAKISYYLEANENYYILFRFYDSGCYWQLFRVCQHLYLHI